MSELQIAYVLDLAVSLPIVLLPFLRNSAPSRFLFGEASPESGRTDAMLGSLWLALVSCLMVGVFLPVVMAPILVLQLIYKSLWLALFALPRWLQGRGDEVSWTLVGIFLTYIVVYPWVIPWEEMFARPTP